MMSVLVMIRECVLIYINRVLTYLKRETLFVMRMVEVGIWIDLAEVGQNEYQAYFAPVKAADFGRLFIHQWLM